MQWQQINSNELLDWQKKIYAKNASLFQFPSWLQAFASIPFFTPKFLKCHINEVDWGYCGLLQIKFGIVKVAVISHGPIIATDNHVTSTDVLGWLLLYLKKHKYTFVRFSGDVCLQLRNISTRYKISDKNSFPFYNDILHNYIITRKENEEALKNSFNGSTRNTINKSVKAPVYKFCIDEEGKYLDEVYTLFKTVGDRKSFNYRPKTSYKDLFINNKQLNFATFYIAFLDNKIVNAILVIRDRHQSLNMSGALDTIAIGDNYTPAKYLHYMAMEHEFFKKGSLVYNMCYSDGHVGEFKKNFNPEYTKTDGPVTVQFNPFLFSIYNMLFLSFSTLIKKSFRKLISNNKF